MIIEQITNDDVINFVENITRDDVDIYNKLNNLHSEMGEELNYLLMNNEYIQDKITVYIINELKCDGYFQICVRNWANDYVNHYADDEELENENADYFCQIGLYNCDLIYITAIQNILEIDIREV